VISGLIFLYGILPGVLHIIAIAIISKFPITPEVHLDIQQQLARLRAEQQEAKS
jgi:Na+/melibiose symporter-like transporter